MKKNAIFALLACVVVLAGCMATQPTTEEERANQARAEQERRTKNVSR